jgi:hypothetical protein
MRLFSDFHSVPFIYYGARPILTPMLLSKRNVVLFTGLRILCHKLDSEPPRIYR